MSKAFFSTPGHPPVIRPQVSDDIYTDREEHLESFWKEALNATERLSSSTVLLGQRRMGKTEIFIRVINRLFWEQDHEDPQAAVPVYYRFLDEPMDRIQFSMDYVDNFLRWYAAFRLRDPEILNKGAVDTTELIKYVKAKLPMTTTLDGVCKVLKGLPKKRYTIPEQIALLLPGDFAFREDRTIIMFLDEFQNISLPQYDVYLVGKMQEAVEGLQCPHFVTGSAMTILTQEIIGRGTLYGRFQYEKIEPLTPYWGGILAQKAATKYKVKLDEVMVPIIATRCGGNPFYIHAVVRQAKKIGNSLTREEELDEVLAVDISSGFIWGELSDQVNRWIKRVNELGGAGHPVTKWVLFLSSLEEGEFISLERIRKELWERDGKEVSLEKISQILIQLSRGDLLEASPDGSWFRKVDDPILVEFLQVWGKLTIENQSPTFVKEEIKRKYQTLHRQFSDHLGYLAEVYLAQILWNGQNKSLPGKFFHQKTDVKMPSSFSYVNLRQRLKMGKDMEIDVHGAAGIQAWLVESKWWNGKKVGQRDVESLLKKKKLMLEEVEKKYRNKMQYFLWFFANDGFTKGAITFMEKNGIFWSTREDLDELLEYVGLRTLPEIK